MIVISNYDFLINDQVQVDKIQFLSTLYIECNRVDENYYININDLFSDARKTLEMTVNYYIECKNIKVKSYNERSYKNDNDKKSIKFNNKRDGELQQKLAAIKPSGEVFVNADWVRKWGNDASHDPTYMGDGYGNEIKCLRNLHDFIVWFYNELTGKDIKHEFSLDNIQKKVLIDVNELESIKNACNKKIDPIKIKKAKLTRKKPLYDFRINNGTLLVLDDQQNIIFEIENDKEQVQTALVEYSSLESKLQQVDKVLDQAAVASKKLEQEMLDYQKRNLIAVEKFQQYCDKYDIDSEKKKVLIDEIEKTRKEENELLKNRIEDIEKSLQDKTDCINYLRDQIELKTCDVNVLNDKITELEVYIILLKETFETAKIGNERKWLCDSVDSINNNFENRSFKNENQDRMFTFKQVVDLFGEFKSRYNELVLKYEGEKITSGRNELQMIELRDKVQYYINENNNKDEQISYINRKNTSLYKRNKIIKYIYKTIITLLAILSGILLGYIVVNKSPQIIDSNIQAMLNSNDESKSEIPQNVMEESVSDIGTNIAFDTDTGADTDSVSDTDTVSDIDSNTNTNTNSNTGINSVGDLNSLQEDILPNESGQDPEETVTTVIVPENQAMDQSNNAKDTTSNIIDDKLSSVKSTTYSIPMSILEIPGFNQDLLADLKKVEYDRLGYLDQEYEIKGSTFVSDTMNYYGTAKVFGIIENGGENYFVTTSKHSLFTVNEAEYIKFVFGIKNWVSNQAMIALSPDDIIDGIDYNSNLEQLKEILGDDINVTKIDPPTDFSTTSSETAYAFNMKNNECLVFCFDENEKICDYAYLLKYEE